eukprot:769738-Prorocentrum_minimum.AAC.3
MSPPSHGYITKNVVEASFEVTGSEGGQIGASGAVSSTTTFTLNFNFEFASATSTRWATRTTFPFPTHSAPIHVQVMLPPSAPRTVAARARLWNSLEHETLRMQIRKKSEILKTGHVT